MPEFILDTQGAVRWPDFGNIRWEDLDAFTRGYIEALFFTSEGPGVSVERFKTPKYQHDMIEGKVDGTIPGDVCFGDLDPAALQLIMSNCRDFQKSHEALLQEAYARDYDPEKAGRDFWFTRNGHGVGFWCRTELERDGLGDRLTAVCGDGTLWTEVDVYFSGDKVCIT